jgi:allantoin racemase
MKIGIVVPNVRMTEKQLAERRNFLMKNAQPGTEILMIKLEKGPLSIESSLEHEQAGYYIAKKIGELTIEGYHAFITWCGEDAGLTSAREVTWVPVIGPFQSSCSNAILLGHKFSIIAPMVQRAFIERKVWELGLGSRLASVRSLGIPVIEVRNNLKKAFSLLEKECKKAVEKDGADVIIFSCMALFGAARSLMEKLKVPIVDPALAALKMAETFVSLGLTHSKISYPFPPK